MNKKIYNLLHNKKNINFLKRKYPLPLGPYTQSIKVGNIIFISGQIGICPHTGNISNNISDQTRQTLINIKNIMEEDFQLNIANLIKITIFLINIENLPIINENYINFFNQYSLNSKKLPTRSCIEVSRLPKNSKIEIESIAKM